MTNSDGRLSRWSRRKMKARRGRPEADPEDASAPTAELPVTEEPEAQLSTEEEAEALRKLDLPAPESLQAGDDFSAFLKKGVPGQIRRRALRLLWRSHPILANVDGLVDYGEDFTDAATVVENLKTVFVVGHGARPIETEEEPPESPDAAGAATADGQSPNEDDQPDDDGALSTEEECAARELPEIAQAEDFRYPAVPLSDDPDPRETEIVSDPPVRRSVRRGMAFRFDA